MNGKIINIQKFCVDDGPGIRTTVFLKGCPLRCIWCHNPESQAKENEILYDGKKCINCGKCIQICSQNCHTVEQSHQFKRNKCIGCGACAKICPTHALELCVQTMSADEVYEEVKKDKIFYETSGGGVTISGGEPLYQPEFTSKILQKCRENGIHTAIETSGFASEKSLLLVIEYCDFVLFDIKATDEKLHKQYTGVSLEPILRNLSIINERGVPFLIRAPIIPTLNDTKEHFVQLKKLRDSMKNCQGIQLMPYHRTGVYKYDLLDRTYACKGIKEPSVEELKSWYILLNE